MQDYFGVYINKIQLINKQFYFKYADDSIDRRIKEDLRPTHFRSYSISLICIQQQPTNYTQPFIFRYSISFKTILWAISWKPLFTGASLHAISYYRQTCVKQAINSDLADEVGNTNECNLWQRLKSVGYDSRFDDWFKTKGRKHKILMPERKCIY